MKVKTRIQVYYSKKLGKRDRIDYIEDIDTYKSMRANWNKAKKICKNSLSWNQYLLGLADIGEMYYDKLIADHYHAVMTEYLGSPDILTVKKTDQGWEAINKIPEDKAKRFRKTTLELKKGILKNDASCIRKWMRLGLKISSGDPSLRL